MSQETLHDELRALCGDDDLLRVLRDPLVWELPELRATRLVASVFAEVEAENATAAALCASLLTGPSSRWPERLRDMPGARAAGMVQQLLERMPALVERRPADALQATSMAIVIADALDPQDYWPDHVLELRAHALRDHAYVLSFLSRHAEAMKYVERAERLFAQLPGAGFDEARLWLVKASVLRMQNRCEEAIALTRKAAGTFLEYEDRPRYVNARITEAAMLYYSGAVERALEVWTSVKGDPGLDALGELRIAHNIAACLSDLGRHAEAVDSFARCVSEFAVLDLPTERTRSRWYLGNALVGTARPRQGIAALRLAWDEFNDLGLPVDAALAALDLADALVANEQPEQVPMICHEVIAQLNAADLATQAIPALSLLREAAAMGRASRQLIRDTHATVKRVGRGELIGAVRQTAMRTCGLS